MNLFWVNGRKYLANEQIEIIFVLEKYKTTSPETEFCNQLIPPKNG